MGIDGAVRDDAVLVASELVTNAVLHARTDIEVRVTSGTVGVLVEVSDLLVGAAEVLTDRAGPPDPGTEHGRGLGLVRGVAARFGAERTASGKTVWALLGPSERR